MKALIKLGYTVEKLSSWDGDKGIYKFCKGNGQWLGLLDTNKKEIKPFHGYYGKHLNGIAKKIGYKLVQ
jgi:hypothetical protein